MVFTVPSACQETKSSKRSWESSCKRQMTVALSLSVASLNPVPYLPKVCTQHGGMLSPLPVLRQHPERPQDWHKAAP